MENYIYNYQEINQQEADYLSFQHLVMIWQSSCRVQGISEQSVQSTSALVSKDIDLDLC